MKSVAILLFLSLFLSLNISVGVFWVDWNNLLSVACFFGFQLLSLGLSYDLTELVLALILPKHDLPKLNHLPEFPPVALLYTTCDDVMDDCLKQLDRQTYPNYDVFVLDDSIDAQCQKTVDRGGGRHTIVRRNTRKGFKAGNLNNWLRWYGTRYKYFVILDNDSMAADDFIEEMVKYAEHPANQHVAIFQSKILPWNTDCLFARIMGIQAPCRMRILERVYNRVGAVFSFGHNNLHRTDIVHFVGGFDESLTPEDTTMTLMLSERGFDCKIVDVVSFDTEPSDVFRYSKRLIRWGRQTVEVFSLPWKAAPLTLKLVLCRHLYAYSISIIYAVLTFFAIWGFKASLDQSLYFLEYGFSQLTSLSPPFVALFVIAILALAQLCLRFAMACEAKISAKDFMQHILLSGAITWFNLFPLAWAVLRSLLGSQNTFEPTNVHSSRQATLLAILREMWLTILFAVLVCYGILVNPGYLINPNVVWIAILLFSPLIIWRFHREKGRRRTT